MSCHFQVYEELFYFLPGRECVSDTVLH